jgi:hypothetical protein
MKPFPNRTSTFQRIRLSPDHTPLRAGAFTESVMTAYCGPGSDLRLRDRLRPFALLRRYPQPRWDVPPTATRTYGRERAIRPNRLYLIEEKGVIASTCAFVVSNSLHGRFPKSAGTGTFTLRWSREKRLVR